MDALTRSAERRMHPLPLNTRSLVLRHFVPDDAPALLLLNAEPTTRAALPSHVYAGLAEAESATRYLIDCYASPADAKQGPYVLGVALRESAELLGHVGFSPLDDEVEISYAIAEAARGRGFGVEALLPACRWAAASFDLDRIVALTAADNLPARRMLDRAGFVHEWDRARRFQGSERHVSRYVWTPGAA
jgi:RimJ/RimL family protein N-acetyltransferase